jgi:uncharacterized membrane protein YidH (DUF202 family)
MDDFDLILLVMIFCGLLFLIVIGVMLHHGAIVQYHACIIQMNGSKYLTACENLKPDAGLFDWIFGWTI